MATLEQLAEGIKRAHAAGNVEHVRALGAAYRQMQQAQGGPVQLQGRVEPQSARPTEGSANVQDMRPEPQRQPLDLGTATAATISGAVQGIPIIGPMAQDISDRAIGGVSALMGGDYGGTIRDLQQGRADLAERAPISNIAGNLAGSVGSLGLASKIPAAASALGMTGNLGARVGNSALSSQGIYTADQMARGNGGLDATGYGVPALVGGAIPLAGAGLKKAGQSVADTVTNMAQRGMTSKAVQGAPSASEVKSAASEMFEAATGGNPLMVSDNAYFRFLGDVRQVANKFRINADNDKQSVGLLNTLMRIADETADGVKVDMKDLHLVRQLAQKVAQSKEGRDQAFASQVIKQMDRFIQTLKPADILGGADPSQAANQLMKGISTWSRANKVATIEEAIRAGSMAASGAENGIRNAFRALAKKPDVFNRFNEAEKRAIMDVVDGTGTANLLKLIGKFGFGTGNASNMLGGTIGFGAGSMSPLGPLGGILAAGAGTAARKGSEAVTVGAANRALGAVATPNVPIARQAPNLMAPAQVPLELLLKGGALAAAN